MPLGSAHDKLICVLIGPTVITVGECLEIITWMGQKFKHLWLN